MIDEAPKDRAEHVVSAGGVVYRHGRRGIEIVLCGRTREGLWALPKGSPEQGETLERTAAREIEEETGLKIAMEGSVGEIRYDFVGRDGKRYQKRVEHHLMVSTGGSLARHDAEFDSVRWFVAEEALRLLTYPNEKVMVGRAVRLIRQREKA